MTSLTFSMAMFCKEINDMINENKLSIAYFFDKTYDCKSYYFTHLKDDDEETNQGRIDKTNLVKEIDYHNMNSVNFSALIDELDLLYISASYIKGDITNLIFQVIRENYDIEKEDHLYKIYRNDENELVEKEKEEHLKEESELVGKKRIKKSEKESVENNKTLSKCPDAEECRNQQCKLLHIWKCRNIIDNIQCEGFVKNGFCANCADVEEDEEDDHKKEKEKKEISYLCPYKQDCKINGCRLNHISNCENIVDDKKREGFIENSVCFVADQEENDFPPPLEEVDSHEIELMKMSTLNRHLYENPPLTSNDPLL